MTHELALPLLAGLILVALAFDFLNGLHDAANSIATVVATKLLSPVKAVIFAATHCASRSRQAGSASASRTRSVVSCVVIVPSKIPATTSALRFSWETPLRL